MNQTDEPDEVGTVAEEAAKLFGALSGWAREHGDGVSSMAGSMAGSVADELHEHLATGAPECAWCPICRTVTALRQTSPEVRAHLTSAASSLLLAIGEMMNTRPPHHPGGVERIDLADDADDRPPEDAP